MLAAPSGRCRLITITSFSRNTEEDAVALLKEAQDVLQCCRRSLVSTLLDRSGVQSNARLLGRSRTIEQVAG